MKATPSVISAVAGAILLSACAAQPGGAQAPQVAATQAGSGPARPAGGHGREAFIGSYDLNGDGVVTRAEYDAVRKQRFKNADKNGDGVLTEEEYVAEFEGRLKEQYFKSGRQPDEAYANSIRQAHVRFALLDRNRDGVLSQDEEQEIMEKTWAQADTNKDGKVDANDPPPPGRN
ncbi:hypothetical protein Herbaro_20590 [Herbaspirillum sp. WKF16]|uniref:EF-hand domain-containing protein n=1 Tax=Herbaspirillum sp. WKF16 TaxID=3028312 RepID=UPI0023A9A951|nr:hypothetical protein [Herbaspirillum sp. WKF16]WDZ95847.1 hypothetical protein Herbaro_20590 [Herbaspirillum sp. WKF16]